MIPSPCVRICLVDHSVSPARCSGCGRTLEQIGRWGYATDAEKQAILDDTQPYLQSLFDEPEPADRRSDP